ncbi:MAG: EVE domain-containing protein [Alphaproteobacteria bacterium]|nr:EVE domain-containing protein [Alphaproteobacteria bacterium]
MPRNYWLVKSEPSSWSWEMQVRAGRKGTRWDGVRNHLAKQHLQAMRAGDRAFFYHSGEGKSITGIVEVIREHYPDPGAPGEPWVAVDVRAVEPLPEPVPLSAVKAEPKLAKMSLVKSARLSVQPVTEAEWEIICRMGAGYGSG